MRNEATRGAVVALLSFLAAASPAVSWAGAIPSKDREEASAAAPMAELDKVREALAQEEVAQALAAHGLTRDEVERRLAELSPEELRALAANVDQVQAAGSVPNYIWILLAIFLAVSILAVVF